MNKHRMTCIYIFASFSLSIFPFPFLSLHLLPSYSFPSSSFPHPAHIFGSTYITYIVCTHVPINARIRTYHLNLTNEEQTICYNKCFGVRKEMSEPTVFEVIVTDGWTDKVNCKGRFTHKQKREDHVSFKPRSLYKYKEISQSGI